MNATLSPKSAICPSEAELKELGLGAAAEQMKIDIALAKKLRVAFEHYRVVEPQHIERFNKELKEKSLVKTSAATGWVESFDRLVFTDIGAYKTVPPPEALQKLREAKAHGCFDSFEIATIESVKIVPDPILFGRISGSGNCYFIAQWDDDVKIEDILREDEG